MLNALSFDVEEWYHAELVRRRVAPEERVSQLEQSLEPILSLLARRRLHATFFIVGEVAAQHPALVQQIAAEGHEIGCHGMSHRPLWELTPETFRDELVEFATLAGGIKPAGYRAPTFSLGPKTAWALPVLAEQGFRYDSSIFPVANYLYGLSGGPLAAYRPALDDLRRHDPVGPLLELPMTVWTVAGQRVPVSGGFYLRALPLWFLLRAFRQVSKERPVVLYLHPWEAFGGTPVVSGLSPFERFVTYYSRSSILAKLEHILDALPFAPLGQVLAPMLLREGDG